MHTSACGCRGCCSTCIPQAIWLAAHPVAPAPRLGTRPPVLLLAALTPQPCRWLQLIALAPLRTQVFALSEELGLWLMIDDAHIALVGHWPDVVKAMAAKRLQPSLMLYEAEPVQLQQ